MIANFLGKNTGHPQNIIIIIILPIPHYPYCPPPPSIPEHLYSPKTQ